MTESELMDIEVKAQRYNGVGVTTTLKLVQEIRIARERILELESQLESKKDFFNGNPLNVHKILEAQASKEIQAQLAAEELKIINSLASGN